MIDHCCSFARASPLHLWCFPNVLRSSYVRNIHETRSQKHLLQWINLRDMQMINPHVTHRVFVAGDHEGELQERPNLAQLPNLRYFFSWVTNLHMSTRH